jgi:hypothetical protein
MRVKKHEETEGERFNFLIYAYALGPILNWINPVHILKCSLTSILISSSYLCLGIPSRFSNQVSNPNFLHIIYPMHAIIFNNTYVLHIAFTRFLLLPLWRLKYFLFSQVILIYIPLQGQKPHIRQQVKLQYVCMF